MIDEHTWKQGAANVHGPVMLGAVSTPTLSIPNPTCWATGNKIGQVSYIMCQNFHQERERERERETHIAFTHSSLSSKRNNELFSINFTTYTIHTQNTSNVEVHLVMQRDPVSDTKMKGH